MNTQDVINFVLNRLGNDNPILRELSNESKRTILEILEKEKPSIIKNIISQIAPDNNELKHLGFSKSKFFDNVHPLLTSEPVSGSFGTKNCIKYAKLQIPDE